MAICTGHEFSIVCVSVNASLGIVASGSLGENYFVCFFQQFMLKAKEKPQFRVRSPVSYGHSIFSSHGTILKFMRKTDSVECPLIFFQTKVAAELDEN